MLRLIHLLSSTILFLPESLPTVSPLTRFICLFKVPDLPRRCRGNNLLPAELPRVIHVGPSLDVAFVRVVDGGGSSVGSSQYEYEAVQAHRRGVFVI